MACTRQALGGLQGAYSRNMDWVSLPACQSSFLSGVPFRNACNSCQRVAQSCQALTAFEAVNGSRREAPLLVIQRLCLKPM